MRDCPETDAIVVIGKALDWKILEGIRHLETCEECREQIEALQLARTAFAPTEVVDPAVTKRVAAILGAAARNDRARAEHRKRWISFVEPIAAGITALLLLRSSGIHVESVTAAAIGFVLGALAITGGRALAQRVPALGLADAGA
jgi:hypothetical protein